MNTKGFGLIEVLVAIVVLSIGILGVSSVVTQSVSMQNMSSQRTSALTIAQVSMERIRAMDPLTIVAQAETAVNESGVPDASGVFTRAVTIADAGRNLIEVTVIVTAPRVSPVRLSTWIYDGAF